MSYDPTMDRLVEALKKNGLRRCWCRACGAPLSAYSREPEVQPTDSPKGGWLCRECGGEVMRERGQA